MTRGNQRDTDRARAAARHAGKGTAKEGTTLSRNEDDSSALQAKVLAKKEREEAAARGDTVAIEAKKPGGSVKKKDGGKK
ncbi:hypothetical protein B484DRAFT_404161 [Ochromonadaceae sp. CCMP2298]|nr:hypothetical protein B484DRAFT_404161 [Ochromonadaceae sp. CCMP2298]|mmetsp:Transcript_27367/g.58962  ORF Transcript_27367/g.58962 Transcript_27367/m.58962 type:complete len:80 (+) Transcript_27367:68-307(+)